MQLGLSVFAGFNHFHRRHGDCYVPPLVVATPPLAVTTPSIIPQRQEERENFSPSSIHSSSTIPSSSSAAAATKAANDPIGGTKEETEREKANNSQIFQSEDEEKSKKNSNQSRRDKGREGEEEEKGREGEEEEKDIPPPIVLLTDHYRSLPTTALPQLSLFDDSSSRGGAIASSSGAGAGGGSPPPAALSQPQRVPPLLLRLLWLCQLFTLRGYRQVAIQPSVEREVIAAACESLAVNGSDPVRIVKLTTAYLADACGRNVFSLINFSIHLLTALKEPPLFQQQQLDCRERMSSGTLSTSSSSSPVTSSLSKSLTSVSPSSPSAAPPAADRKQAAQYLKHWLKAQLSLCGPGNWLEVVAPIRLALEELQVDPPSLFRWVCGCGTVVPCTAIRCSKCLRQSHGKITWCCSQCRDLALDPAATSTASTTGHISSSRNSNNITDTPSSAVSLAATLIRAKNSNTNLISRSDPNCACRNCASPHPFLLQLEKHRCRYCPSCKVVRKEQEPQEEKDAGKVVGGTNGDDGIADRNKKKKKAAAARGEHEKEEEEDVVVSSVVSSFQSKRRSRWQQQRPYFSEIPLVQDCPDCAAKNGTCTSSDTSSISSCSSSSPQQQQHHHGKEKHSPSSSRSATSLHYCPQCSSRMANTIICLDCGYFNSNSSTTTTTITATTYSNSKSSGNQSLHRRTMENSKKGTDQQEEERKQTLFPLLTPSSTSLMSPSSSTSSISTTPAAGTGGETTTTITPSVWLCGRCGRLSFITSKSCQHCRQQSTAASGNGNQQAVYPSSSKSNMLKKPPYQRVRHQQQQPTSEKSGGNNTVYADYFVWKCGCGASNAPTRIKCRTGCGGPHGFFTCVKCRKVSSGRHLEKIVINVGEEQPGRATSHPYTASGSSSSSSHHEEFSAAEEDEPRNRRSSSNSISTSGPPGPLLRQPVVIVRCQHCHQTHPRDSALLARLAVPKACLFCGVPSMVHHRAAVRAVVASGTQPQAQLNSLRRFHHHLVLEEDGDPKSSNSSTSTCWGDVDEELYSDLASSFAVSHGSTIRGINGDEKGVFLDDHGQQPAQDICRNCQGTLLYEPQEHQCWWCGPCESPALGFACSHCDRLHPKLQHPLPNEPEPFMWKCTRPIHTAPSSRGSGGRRSSSEEKQATIATMNSVLCGAWTPSWSRRCHRCHSLRPHDTAASKEIRARYLRWTCVWCSCQNGPQDVLFCRGCKQIAVNLPPCVRCGIPHAALQCLPKEELLPMRPGDHQQRAEQ